jgi:hypothetical protein
MCRRKRQQCQVARTLDRDCQAALVPGARASAPTWQDLASVGDIALEALDVFVVGDTDFICAETTDFTARDKFAPTTAARAAARAAAAAAPPSIFTHGYAILVFVIIL